MRRLHLVAMILLPLALFGCSKSNCSDFQDMIDSTNVLDAIADAPFVADEVATDDANGAGEEDADVGDDLVDPADADGDTSGGQVPGIEFIPESIDFSFYALPSQRILTVRNSGNVPLELTWYSVVLDSGKAQIAVEGSFPLTIAVGDQVSLPIRLVTVELRGNGHILFGTNTPELPSAAVPIVFDTPVCPVCNAVFIPAGLYGPYPTPDITTSVELSLVNIGNGVCTVAALTVVDCPENVCPHPFEATPSLRFEVSQDLVGSQVAPGETADITLSILPNPGLQPALLAAKFDNACSEQELIVPQGQTNDAGDYTWLPNLGTAE